MHMRKTCCSRTSQKHSTGFRFEESCPEHHILSIRFFSWWYHYPRYMTQLSTWYQKQDQATFCLCHCRQWTGVSMDCVWFVAKRIGLFIYFIIIFPRPWLAQLSLFASSVSGNIFLAHRCMHLYVSLSWLCQLQLLLLCMSPFCLVLFPTY